MQCTRSKWTRISGHKGQWQGATGRCANTPVYVQVVAHSLPRQGLYNVGGHSARARGLAARTRDVDQPCMQTPCKPPDHLAGQPVISLAECTQAGSTASRYDTQAGRRWCAVQPVDTSVPCNSNPSPIAARMDSNTTRCSLPEGCACPHARMFKGYGIGCRTTHAHAVSQVTPPNRETTVTHIARHYRTLHTTPLQDKCLSV